MEANNMLAMREALTGLMDGICFHCDLSEDCKGTPCEKMQKAKAALAAPPRNCDVGTAEEQTARYDKFCNTNKTVEKCCTDCPALGTADCELLWAQMPYEEGGAK